MAQVAQNAVNQRMSSNIPIGRNDTICVVNTLSGRVYVGFSGMDNIQGMPMEKHAEIDAVNNMMMYNDVVINALTLFNITTMTVILPCVRCVETLLRLNPNNSNAMVITPTNPIPLMSLRQAGPMSIPVPQPQNNMKPTSVPASRLFGMENMPAANTAPVVADQTVQDNVPSPNPEVSDTAPASSSVTASASKKSASMSAYVAEKEYGGQFLMNKLNQLLDDGEDEEDAREKATEAKNKEKGSRGLFGKR